MQRQAARLIIALLFSYFFVSTSTLSAEDSQPQVIYSKAIAPILQKYCITCHGGKRPRADFSLENIKTDAEAEEARKHWDKVIRVLQAREMPPERKPQPTPNERALLLQYLDQQLAAVNCLNDQNPGKVTIRRLNRFEYNNTIRDLIGVKFKPADDFPSDDVGYGFDNIGDVLSMSPLLVEKYLAAAERIVSLALGKKRSRTIRTLQAKDLGVYGKHSTLKDGSRALNPQTKLSRGQYFRENAKLQFRLKVYGQGMDKGPIKLQFDVDGKTIAEKQITGTQQKPETIYATADISRGSRSLTIRFPDQPKGNNDPRRLVVQTLEVRTPPEPLLPASYDRIMIARPRKGLTSEQAAHRVISHFAKRAFRRPVTDDEIARYVKLVKLAQTNGDGYETGIRLAVQAILVSPHFLFRVEQDTANVDEKGVRTINEFELATRLSYFLWSSMPDDELFKLAEQGQLRKNLDAQIKRMLADNKAKALVKGFGRQWLQIGNLLNLEPDPKAFPKYDAQLRADMITETEMFLEHIFREDRNVLELIDADYTFINRRLASHYGLWRALPRRTRGFVKVNLDDKNPRGGIITMGSVLTVTSNPTRTSPVKRGKWILENLLNSPPPPPPPDAGELEEGKTDDESLPLRERLEIHRSKPMCASCHSRMDPLGFALENFDGIGQWRSSDGKHKIDTRAELSTGEKFNGPTELKKILLQRKEQFARCLAEKMLTYGLGRGLDYYDRCAVDDIVTAMTKENYRFSGMVRAIVHSEPFQRRNVKSAKK